ncbi:MAG TPA: hypothetical protein VN515_02260 [Terriglobales bacterium]|nr:hypothetical protein [Terriglobales bacterium]
MAPVQPLRREEEEPEPHRPHLEHAHGEPVRPHAGEEVRRHPEYVTGHRLRIGRASASYDTPAHVPGTKKGEETVLRSPEKGRRGKTRTARSSTAINAKLRDPLLPGMPHLPPA